MAAIGRSIQGMAENNGSKRNKITTLCLLLIVGIASFLFGLLFIFLGFLAWRDEGRAIAWLFAFILIFVPAGLAYAGIGIYCTVGVIKDLTKVIRIK